MKMFRLFGIMLASIVASHLAFAQAVPVTKPFRGISYSATVSAFSPAASATDFFTLTGSVSKVIRVKRLECSGISTANAVASLESVVRSTADTGTAVVLTAVPHDSGNAAATATAVTYAANPTTGTLVGRVRDGKLSTGIAATSTMASSTLVWTFGDSNTQEIVLRGIGQVFALNGKGATFASGTALDCNIDWTEE